MERQWERMQGNPKAEAEIAEMDCFGRKPARQGCIAGRVGPGGRLKNTNLNRLFYDRAIETGGRPVKDR